MIPKTKGEGEIAIGRRAGCALMLASPSPHDRLTGAGGGKTVVINQTFHFHGPAPSRQDRTQIMAEIGLATQRALARNT